MSIPIVAKPHISFVLIIAVMFSCLSFYGCIPISIWFLIVLGNHIGHQVFCRNAPLTSSFLRRAEASFFSPCLNEGPMGMLIYWRKRVLMVILLCLEIMLMQPSRCFCLAIKLLADFACCCTFSSLLIKLFTI